MVSSIEADELTDKRAVLKIVMAKCTFELTADEEYLAD